MSNPLFDPRSTLAGGFQTPSVPTVQPNQQDTLAGQFGINPDAAGPVITPEVNNYMQPLQEEVKREEFRPNNIKKHNIFNDAEQRRFDGMTADERVGISNRYFDKKYTNTPEFKELTPELQQRARDNFLDLTVGITAEELEGYSSPWFGEETNPYLANRRDRALKTREQDEEKQRQVEMNKAYTPYAAKIDEAQKVFDADETLRATSPETRTQYANDYFNKNIRDENYDNLSDDHQMAIYNDYMQKATGGIGDNEIREREGSGHIFTNSLLKFASNALHTLTNDPKHQQRALEREWFGMQDKSGAGTFSKVVGGSLPYIGSAVATGGMSVGMGLSLAADVVLTAGLATLEHARDDRNIQKIALEVGLAAGINGLTWGVIRSLSKGDKDKAAQELYNMKWSELPPEEAAKLSKLEKQLDETPLTPEQQKNLDDLGKDLDELAGGPKPDDAAPAPKPDEPIVINEKELLTPDEWARLEKEGFDKVPELADKLKNIYLKQADLAVAARTQRDQYEAAKATMSQTERLAAIDNIIKIKEAEIKLAPKYDIAIKELENIKTERARLESYGGTGNKLFAQGGATLGGGFAGGTEAIYQDIVNGRDLSTKEYLARIGIGAGVGAAAGKLAGGKPSKSTASMFGASEPAVLRKTKPVVEKKAPNKLKPPKPVKAEDLRPTYEVGAHTNLGDKKTRKWISDNDLTFIPKAGDSTTGKLPEFIDHPELFKREPYLKDINVEDDYTFPSDSTKGSYNPGTNTLKLAKGLSDEEKLSVIAHEVQHGIQEENDWARGGNTDTVKNEVSAMEKKIEEKYKAPLAAYDKAWNRTSDLTEMIRLKKEGATPEDLKKHIDESEFLMGKMWGRNFKVDFDMKSLEELQKLKELSAERMERRFAALKPYNEALKKLNPLQAKSNFELYQQLAGEQEARATQAALKHPGMDPYKALELEEGKLPRGIVTRPDKHAEMSSTEKPYFVASTFKNNGKADANGRRTFKRTIHMKDGSRLSGMTDDKTFYGYDKNGESFTIQARYVDKSQVENTNKASNQFLKSGEMMSEGKPVKTRTKLPKVSNIPTIKNLDTSAPPADLVTKASKGDQAAFDVLARAVFDRVFDTTINKNTSDDLKPMVIDILKDTPNIVEDLAAKYGYEIKYFTSVPEKVGKKIGNKELLARPQTGTLLKREGYQAGVIWVYDPTDDHGSFNDPEYTKAWRGIHELAHALTERMMQAKYGNSKRFGALGLSTRNPYSEADKKIYKPLTLEQAQRAIEWEDVAFRTQVELLEDLGVKISKKQAIDDFNIAGLDTVIRTMTGDFSDPGKYGVTLPKKSEKIDLKDVLKLLEHHEESLAAAQGREPTKGIDLATWRPVTDKELSANIELAKEMPVKVTGHPEIAKDEKVFFSVEGVAGVDVHPTMKKIIQSLPEIEQKAYLEELVKATSDAAGFSLIARKLGLEMDKSLTSWGVWKGETNPLKNFPVKAERNADGTLTEAFKSKINTMAEMYAVAFRQDGVGWHYPNYKSTKIEDQNGFDAQFGRLLTNDETAQLEKNLSEAGMKPGTVIISNVDTGVHIINMSDIPNGKFHKIAEDSLSHIEDDFDAERFASDGNLIEGVKRGNAINKNSLTRGADLQEWFDDAIVPQIDRVNNRFKEKAGDIEHGVEDKKQINWSEHKGHAIVPIFADLTKYGSIDSYGNFKFPEAEMSLGGPQYARSTPSIDEGSAWAGRKKSFYTSLKNKANKLYKEGKIKDPNIIYGVVTNMASDAHQSNTTIVNIIVKSLEAVELAGKMSATTKKALRNAIQTRGKQINSKRLQNFPDFKDKKAVVAAIDAASFDERSAIAQALDQAGIKDLEGVPRVKRILNTMLDEEYGANKMNHGQMIIKFDLSEVFEEGGLGTGSSVKHPSYHISHTGKYVGDMNRPVDIAYMFPRFLKETRGTTPELAVRDDYRSMEMNGDAVQVMDDDFIKVVDKKPYKAIQNPNQASIVNDFVNDDFKMVAHSGTGATITPYMNALKDNPKYADALHHREKDKISKAIKKGTLKIYKAANSEAYITVDGKKIESVVVNEVSAVSGESVMVTKAVSDGANKADVIADPATVAALKQNGFEITKEYKKRGVDYVQMRQTEAPVPDPEIVKVAEELKSLSAEETANLGLGYKPEPGGKIDMNQLNANLLTPFKFVIEDIPFAAMDAVDWVAVKMQKMILKGNTADVALGKLLKGGSDNQLFDQLKKMLIQDYRLSDKYLELADAAQIEIKRGEVAAHKMFKQLEDLSDGQLQQIHDYVGGEADAISPHLKPIADSMKRAIKNLSQQLVDLGLLPQDVMDAYKKGYVHRDYEKHLQKSIMDFFYDGQKKLLKQYKRGKLELVEETEYAVLLGSGQIGTNIRDAKYTYEGMKNGKRQLRRDWTKAERDQMGEITNASYTIPNTVMRLQKDISYGKFLAEIKDQMPDLVHTNDEMKVLTNVQHVKDIPEKGHGFVKLNGQEYGKLNGLWVEEAVANDIKGFKTALYGKDNKMGELWQTGVTQWKVAKTVKNPTAHVNNFVANMVMGMYTGVKPSVVVTNWWSAARSISKEDALFKEAESIGLFGRSKLEDIRRVIDKPANITRGKFNRLARNIYMAEDSAMGNMAFKAYEWEDNVGRLSLYKYYRDKGLSPQKAKAESAKVVFDYTRRMPYGINFLRDTALIPFVSWTYKALPLMAKTLAQKPSRLLALYGMYAVYEHAMLGDPDNKPEFMRGKYLTVAKNGDNVTELRTASMTPYLDWVSEPLESVRQQISGGIPQKVLEGFNGVQLWNGRAISYRKGAEKVLDYSLWGANSFLPVPGYLQKVYNVAEAATVQPKKDKLMKPRTVPEAAAGLFGVNIRTYKQSKANELRRRQEKDEI